MLFRQSCVGGGDSGYGGRATESVCSAAVLEALLRGNTPRYNWCYGKSRYYLWRHVRGCGKRSLIIEWTNTYRKCSQKHNCICNIQGVSLYTNVSANYMFRPLLVRPSSGWIPWSEEMYNSAIQPLKSGGGRDLVYKNGACVQTRGIKICILIEISSPPPNFNGCIALLYIPSD